MLLLAGCQPGNDSNAVPQIPPSVTFNRDIAPILFEHCAPCHRPGQSGPFDLLAYQDARKRAPDLVKVTQSRYMPPWPPEAGYGEFANERRLSDQQLALIERWAQQGALEGDPADLPPVPVFSEGWHLGEPDLVLELGEPYLLAPEGPDVYRNFVLPATLSEARYVRAIELLPGNPSLHHARIMVDATGRCRELEQQDPVPGFDGMQAPALFPSGHLLTWVPGKIPLPEPEGMSWNLEPGTDLVLQLHLQRTGKAESVAPRLGLYFTPHPPRRAAFLIGLLAMDIEIPAGASNHLVERTFDLPAEVEVLSLLPHLHYLGKEAHLLATRPDGKQQWLLRIDQWDFNWQGDYRLSEPVPLPKGTRLTMRYTYDNSAGNIRNPNQPPRPVTYGPESTDEMGEIWIQVAPRRSEDLALLQRQQRLSNLNEQVRHYQRLVASQPGHASAHLELGKVLGPLGRAQEAQKHFETALSLDDTLLEPRYYLGLIALDRQLYPLADSYFEAVLALDPGYGKARDGLGLSALAKGQIEQAEAHFKEALRLNPNDPMASQNLQRIEQFRKSQSVPK